MANSEGGSVVEEANRLVSAEQEDGDATNSRTIVEEVNRLLSAKQEDGDATNSSTEHLRTR